MFLRLGLASADERDGQQDGQYQCAHDNCSHQNVPLRVWRNPDQSASHHAELSRRNATGTRAQMLGGNRRAAQSAGSGSGKCTRSLATLSSSTSAPERANAPIISSTSHSGEEALAVRPSARTPSSIAGSTSAIESTRNARAPRIRATSTSRFAFELCFEPTTRIASLTCPLLDPN